MKRSLRIQLGLRYVCLSLTFALGASTHAWAQAPTAPSPVNVWTWHNDNWRTGQNQGEATLTPSSVKSTQFGQICSYPVDGQVYAQPLVLWDAANNRNVVYVVTQNDSVYMFNGTNFSGTNCGLIASAVTGTSSSLIPGQTAVPCGNIGGRQCGVIAPWVGILGTPVIDENTNHIYLVTYSTDGVNYYHYIHALFTGLSGTTALAEDKAGYNSPVQISSGSFTPTFSSFHHIQRPGLLLLPSTNSSSPEIYVGFSMMDGDSTYPPGFIFRYYGDDLKRPPLVYTTEPTAGMQGGGIWMDGAGLAAGLDSAGSNFYLYFTTADGNFDSPSGGMQSCVDCGDSFVKLTTNLGVSSSFTPIDQACRFDPNTQPDHDFGSGGVMLIPDNLLNGVNGEWRYLALSADKNVPPATSGNIYVISRPSPGLYLGGTTCAHGNNTNIKETIAGTGLYHNTGAFWQTGTGTGYLYYAPVNGAISQYPVQSTPCPPGQPPVCNAIHTSVDISGNSATFGAGTTPSISSNGTSNGIVWALTGMSVEGTNMGGLWAFDATNMAHLYNTTQCSQDHIYSATTFSVPTIANGYVYVGAQSDNSANSPTKGQSTFYVFGLMTTKTCTP